MIVTYQPPRRIWQVGLHICAWAFFIFVPLSFLSINRYFIFSPDPPITNNSSQPAIAIVPAFPNAMIRPFDPNWVKYESLVTNAMLAAFFYVNMFLLIPKILARRGWALYTIVVGAALALYLILGYIVRVLWLNPAPPFSPPLLIGVPNFLMAFGISFGLRHLQDKNEAEKRLKENENEKLKAELSFLRGQMSPHFVFNVLNSLTALARKKSDNIESALLQLSQLMRYTLYQTHGKVTLRQEMEYLSNYIALQKLRFGQKCKIVLQMDALNPDELIEPMLLIPFVENSFKHGLGMLEDPLIEVTLCVRENQLSFTTRNKISTFNSPKEIASGIGLVNVTRRLDLLYHKKYELRTYTTQGAFFVVELKLHLQ